MKQFWFVALLVSFPITGSAQTPTGDASLATALTRDPRVAPTAAATAIRTAPAIDGRLDDAAWAEAPAIGTFTQRDPEEGAPASEATEVQIVYDHEAIYIAARLHDRSPVTSRLGRRDMPTSGSDWFRVSLDSLHDRRTAFRFDVNPSGVRRDSVLTGGGSSSPAGQDGDLAWDGVWDAAAAVNGDGWTAEMRIPFSQLNFAPADEQVWGLQIERVIDRRQETAMFSFTPKAEAGGIPNYGTLQGLGGIRPGRRLELLPYAISNARFSPTGNRSLGGSQDVSANAGLDARYRITSNLTLAATANPDFGQVEVDPAVINLTVFETRYEEKRPFFVEGARSFKFGGTVGGPSATAASVFYSRRLGRPPQLDINADQKDIPPTATIAAAAKLSGKTPSGWSIGVLNALTDRETGRYLDGQGVEQRALVEPRTNYFVGRVNRELRRGQTAIGGIFTSVNRQMTDAAGLRSSAQTGGLDFVHEFANRTWTVTGFLIGTQVRGSEKAILATQRSSLRYFQRPDARRARLDPHATSMSGVAATVQLKKSAGLHWTTDSWIQMVSPGFEVNDIGFLQRADRRAFGHGVHYNQRTPRWIFRDWRFVNYVNYAENFDRDVIDYFYRTQLTITHLSYWQADLNAMYEPEKSDDRLTRGGPLAKKPASWTFREALRSDIRKPVIGNVEVLFYGDRAGNWVRMLDTGVELRTSPRWNLSVGPKLTEFRYDAQYVAAVSDPAMIATWGTRHIFAPIDQTELSLVTRLNVTFTPDLSLELYMQPLVANGAYGTPRQFQQPSSYEFAEYGADLGTRARTATGYSIDPDGAGALQPFSVPDRSFTTRSLRGNAVLRWEYRPGSTLFLVWQQDRLDPSLMDDFSVGRAFGSVFGGKANNVLAVKWTYWINP